MSSAVDMNAIIISEFGGPEVLVLKKMPKPSPGNGQVLINVKAFGINRAEMYMRRGEWAESTPISGIECVGVVEGCPGGEFDIGTPVAAVMGGLGRSINGSYAEYTCVRAANVVALGRDVKSLPLPWSEIAAIPESYATAWMIIFGNLELQRGQKLLIRGATSALGVAAINLAVQQGALVTSTTRNTDRFAGLRALGVSDVLEEGPNFFDVWKESGAGKFDAVLNLVGNHAILETLKMVRPGGRMCLAGFLGGLAPLTEFNPLLQMASGVHFSFFGSFVIGEEGFEISKIPLARIIGMIANGAFKAKPWKVLCFEDVREAHRLMETGEAEGKMVITLVGEA